MTLRLGEVVLIRMQFHQATGAKVRPAVVLLDTGDDDFVAARSRRSQGILNTILWWKIGEPQVFGFSGGWNLALGRGKRRLQEKNCARRSKTWGFVIR